MNDIGKIFKKIRMDKSLSLSYVSKNICSLSTLSRFENGQGDIPVKKFLLLLDKLSVTPFEFFLKLKTKFNRNNSFLNKNTVHYNKNDVKHLKNDVLQKSGVIT